MQNSHKVCRKQVGYAQCRMEIYGNIKLIHKHMKSPFTYRTSRLRTLCVSFLIATTIALSSCSVMLPVSASSGTLGGSKVGTATAIGILGFWPNADASIETAAKNGGITKVSTVNVKVSSYLWIVTTYQTKVIGD